MRGALHCTIVKRMRAFWVEMRARSAGRRAMNSSVGRPIGRATRDITGPMGTAFSNAWDKLDEHGDTEPLRLRT